MGLENIDKLHRELGNPLQKVPTVVHVAGTNGKGSVCIKVARSLEAIGLRTGLFVSPHISCFRERVQINGEQISEMQVEELLPKVFELVSRKNIPATFFEMTTALAFMHFGLSGAQAVVLETGLGGRLDSTNICRPAVTVITSISRDHTKILGETEEEIAAEKAGIMKAGVPVVIGPMENQAALDVLLRIASEKKTGPVHLVKSNGKTISNDFMINNERVAAATLRALEEYAPEAESLPFSSLSENVLSSALSATPPCRFERVTAHGFDFILDVAHNQAALKVLFSRIAQIYGEDSLSSVKVIVGMSADKNLVECLGSLRECVPDENIYLVQANHPRSAPVSEMLEIVPRATACSSVEYGIDEAMNQAGSEGHSATPIIVCGSLYIMDAVRCKLGMSVVSDPVIVQEAWSNRKAGLNKDEISK